MATKNEIWQIDFREWLGSSQNGLLFAGARRRGRGPWLTAEQLPEPVVRYLHIQKLETCWVIPDFKSVEDLRCEAHYLKIQRARQGQFKCLVEIPVEALAALPGKPGKSVRGMISNLADLCDYWDVDVPSELNRRVYRSTDCGASLSIQLMDGTWIHNGADQWEKLTRKTLIRSFTIQTIVEGSEATVDSEPFYLPVATSLVDNWVKEMESQAEILWQNANRQWFAIDRDGEYWTTAVYTWEGLRWQDEFSEIVETIPDDPDAGARAELKRLFEEEQMMQQPHPRFPNATVDVDDVEITVEGRLYRIHRYVPEMF